MDLGTDCLRVEYSQSKEDCVGFPGVAFISMKLQLRTRLISSLRTHEFLTFMRGPCIHDTTH
jgi:hypothetical protein